ncbi:hypothetical protein TL16_g00510 [Triparma laevis f. inornata]|uniref:TNFR-Cys domain-containing protein n=1 Tax=Triparma laevis f. inornata TaxID=1714386 RepID=A0A9W7DNE4_9STRA|nr:hypothetical protein TL16_g00510 [Triparma laevis f. inornata]
MTDNSFFLPGGILDEHHSPSRTDSSDDLLNMAVGFSNTLSSGLRSTSLDGPNNDGHSLTHAGRGLNENSSIFGNAQPNSHNLNGLNESFQTQTLPGLDSSNTLLTPSLVSTSISALGGEALQNHMNQLNSQQQYQQNVTAPPPGLSSPPGLRHQSSPTHTHSSHSLTSSPASYPQPSPYEHAVSEWDDPPAANAPPSNNNATAQLKQMQLLQQQMLEKEKAAAALAAKKLKQQQNLLKQKEEMERKKKEREENEEKKREEELRVLSESLIRAQEAENIILASHAKQLELEEAKRKENVKAYYAKKEQEQILAEQQRLLAEHNELRVRRLAPLPPHAPLISSDLALKASLYMSQIHTLLTSVFRLISKAHSYAYISISNFNVMWPFLFPFVFQTLIKFQAEYLGSPQWAPVCLWYSFLIQNFYGESDYTSLPTSLLLWVLRAVTPIMFLMEGVSEKCFVLGLSGSELLAVSGLLASIKRGHVFHPISLGFLGVYILVMSCIEEFTLISTLLQYFFFVTWLNVFYLVDHQNYLSSSSIAPYDGDEVILQPGTLTPDSTSVALGVMIFLSKAVSLTCDSTSTTCVLNGNREVQIMQAYFVAIEEVTLTRIKFYKGKAVAGSSSMDDGGAIFLSGPTLILNKCYFHWNYATQRGGAIYVNGGRITLHGTSFAGSTTANSAGLIGDEIYRDASGAGTVILTNSCPEGYEGPATQGSAIEATGSVIGSSYKYSYTCTTICPAGKYSENGNAGDCTWCPDGKFLADTGTLDPLLHDSPDDCQDCGAGYYTEDIATGPCTFCPAGKYRLNNGNAACTDCPQGKYNDHVPSGSFGDQTYHDSLNDCESCEPGKYETNTGVTSCTNCDAGRYNELSGKTAVSDCLLCGVGTYGPDEGHSSACANCDIGNQGSSSCRECEAGKYAQTAGTTVCSNCDAGKTSSGGSDDCDPCETGKYSTAGLEECRNCEAENGYVSPAGASECDFCGPGQYARTNAICANCLPGTYSVGGTNSCTSCDAGKVASGDAAQSCEYCGPGKFANTDTNSCENCGLGTFSLGGSNSCTSCVDSDGEVGSSVGASACELCGPGKAAIEGQCASCPAGKYSEGGTNECSICPSNKYSGEAGWSSCQPCNPGYIPNGPNDSCDQCAAGKLGQFGSTLCALCQDGKYSQPGSSSCATIPAGQKVTTTTVGSFDLRTGYSPCAAGTYSLGNSDDCTPCESGEQSDAGAAGCVPCAICAPGKYKAFDCSTTSDTQCTICALGKASMGDEETSCTACSGNGKYSDQTEASVCKTAPAGKKPTENRQNIEDCPAGKYSIGGAEDCSDCGDGERSNDGAAGCSTCAVCEPGKYKASDCTAIAETQCTSCVKGKASMGGDVVACDACDSNGQYSDEDNASVCKTSAAGKKPTENREDIENCAAGRYSVGAADVCEACESGETSAAGAAGCSTCATCSVGRYKISDCTISSETDCGDCVAGKASMGGDATTCDDCDGEGQYSDDSLAAACKIAPAGYKPADDHDGLEQCLKNFFSIGASSSCSPCENGGHSLPGAAACEACSSGKFYNEESIKCENCPPGMYSPSGASSLGNCQACEDPGSYSTAGSAACSLAPSGYIPTSSRFALQKCDVGTYSEGLADECKPCPEGFVSQAGSAACSPCPQYQRQDPGNLTKCVCNDSFEREDGDGDSQCTCKPGETLAGTTCVVCDLNKFKSIFKVESCTACDLVLVGGITRQTSSTSADQCVCPAGTFKDGKICRDVPRGVNSTKIGMSLHDMALETGFWRTSGNSTVIRECLVEEACKGGSNSTDQCRDHHWGPLCDRCDERYSKSVYGICQACSGTASDTLYTLLALFILAVIMACIWSFVIKKMFKKNSIRSLKTGVKIMFSGWQIIVNIPSVVPNIIVPENFEKVLTAMQFLTFDLFTIVSIRCWTLATNFYHHLLTATIAPVFLCMLLAALALAMKKRKNQFLTIALALTYLTFPTVSTTLMKFFPCDEMDDGEKWLRADYSISCKAWDRTSMAIFSVVMVGVYPIGVPALYFYLLAKNKARIKRPIDEREEDDSIIGISFLFESYKPEFWWFELAETTRRLLMTGILSVIEPGSETQLFAGILLSMLACVMTAWCSPYIDRRDNIIAVSMNLQIALITLTALALKRQIEGVGGDTEDSGYDEKGIGVLLIIYSMINVIIFLFYGWAEVNSERAEQQGIAEAEWFSSTGARVFAASAAGRGSRGGRGGLGFGVEEGEGKRGEEKGVELLDFNRQSSETSFEYENPMANPAAKGRGGR